MDIFYVTVRWNDTGDRRDRSVYRYQAENFAHAEEQATDDTDKNHAEIIMIEKDYAN